MIKKLFTIVLLSLGASCAQSSSKTASTPPARGPLAIGSLAPDFSLLDQDKKLRSLSEFKQSYVVVYFYPADETPGCTKQACSIRDSFENFRTKNITVLGISYDSPEHHKKFKQKHNLPFVLLSDSDKKIAKIYGAKRVFFIPYPKRKTFVINPNGVICGILPDVEISTHVQDIFGVIEKDKLNG
jgi:peroxiredoxin Q/BCP